MRGPRDLGDDVEGEPNTGKSSEILGCVPCAARLGTGAGAWNELTSEPDCAKPASAEEPCWDVRRAIARRRVCGFSPSSW